MVTLCHYKSINETRNGIMQMRKITQAEYETSARALAAYDEYCKPYVQKNGWTCIPKDTPRFVFDGETIDSDKINAHSTNVGLFTLERDMPEKFTAYAVIDNTRSHISTWTGEIIGRVTHEREWHRNNLGARWRQLTIRSDWGHVYSGREYGSRQCVNFRRVKG